uniref:F-box protein 36b n=1 Tax=Gadus morhua TaxID=8049 RepID=A0A8C5AJE6_GADMO
MASLLKEPLFEISAQGPAPNKDFYQLSITKSDVIWRYWKISLRNASRNAKPGEQRESHQDYLEDTRLQSQVGLVFGQGIQAYTLALGRGCYDYLERLPDALLLRILAHLQLEEVGALGQTSHRFRKLCSSEAFWEQAVRGHWETVPAEVGSLGLELGWRRVFFTSKLQLQKLISRQRQGLHMSSSTVCHPETRSRPGLGLPLPMYQGATVAQEVERVLHQKVLRSIPGSS